MPDRESAIINSVHLMNECGAELEALKADLEKRLLQLGNESPVTFGQEIDPPTLESYDSSKSGWVFDGWRWTFPARERRTGRGPRANVGKLSIVADLGRRGRPANALGVPCLIVTWGPPFDDWNEDIDEARFWPPDQGCNKILSERLFLYFKQQRGSAIGEAKAGMDAVWFYVLPLLSLDERGKLTTLIVNPVCSLLRGDAPSEAFKGAEAVLRFQWNADGPALIPDTSVHSALTFSPGHRHGLPM